METLDYNEYPDYLLSNEDAIKWDISGTYSGKAVL